MITAVLFDLYETLITESGIQPTRASSLAATLGLIGRADPIAIQGICRRRIREKALAYSLIHDGVAALVRSLSRRGVRLAVISNGLEEDVLGWSDCSLAAEIRCAVFSCAERVAKPDSAIYQRALLRLGVDQATTIYVGDGGDDELAGAERAGLRAYRAAWFRNSPQNATWPELTDCNDVLRLVEAG